MLEFLLRRGEEEMTRRTLDGMALGGMYDLVGGGFHRYSVDARWLVPHFEKMLYDNALLASVYLHAWRRFGDERYRRVAEQTVDYVLRELALEGGGFASAQDADTDGVEGLTFTWAPGEGAPEELLEPFEDGRFVLRGELDDETRARLLEHARAAAAAAARRQGDRVVERADARCARAGRAASSRRGRARASSCSARSRRPTGACTEPWRERRREGHRLPRGLRRRRVRADASCTSRPATRAGCARRTGSRRSPSSSSPTTRAAVSSRRRADGEQLVARKKELDDHPTPSGNAMLAYVLLRLARIWGDDELERRAVSVLRLVRDALHAAPSAFGWMLVALDQHLAPHRELAIVGSPDAPVARAALGAAARRRT